MQRFELQAVSQHIQRIILPCGVCVYLVQGTNGAVLLDTGFNMIKSNSSPSSTGSMTCIFIIILVLMILIEIMILIIVLINLM